MKTECILELMKEKEHIKMFKIGLGSMPIMHRVEVYRGEIFAKKLYNAIEKDGNYLVAKRDVYCREFELCKKEDVEKWLTKFEEKEVTETDWKPNFLENQIFNFADEKGYVIGRSDYSRKWVKVTNLKLQKERLKKVKKENQEALDLLEQLL